MGLAETLRHETPQPHDMFVPREQEAAYLRAHHMELRKLSNGITIVGIAQEVEHEAGAEIYFTFPSGSYNDPDGKEGMHHLIAHFVMEDSTAEAAQNDTEINDETRSSTVEFTLRGAAKPTVPNYGIWPVIPVICSSLANPLESLQESAKFENEKKVVHSELERQREADMTREARVAEFIRRTVYALDNPFLKENVGTHFSLDAISLADAKRYAATVFIPHGMNISFLTQGQHGTEQVLADLLQSQFSKFPRADVRGRIIDDSLKDRLNPDYRPGKTYEGRIRSGNFITAQYHWRFPKKKFTRSQFALDLFMPLVHDRLFSYFRGHGFGYETNVEDYDTPSNTIRSLSLEIPRMYDWKALVSDAGFAMMRKEVLEKIEEEELAAVIAKEKERLKAVDVSPQRRLELAQEGLRKGRIIDADKVKAGYNKVTPQDLVAWRDSFLAQDPAVIVAGNLR